MSWTTLLAVYAVVWWLCLFVLLPIGVHQPEEPETGHEPGAPVRPHMWKKVAATSLLAALVTALVMGLIEAGVLDFRPQRVK
ncbi:MAG TPA: DUF1467 family protein [Alphaproteobacteria bacterium]|jgi:predicted secreted protein|nr:DUF1467 family protein [Alphaproteobacteria bacterium]MDP6269456.1 DUF1467 family protein [Alphaproteobacteria bacterium]MDP7163934.1 DUF1467 family protein [Alphaproteobacteria bacterium]HJM50979.1 DUF1467 family protein [Alphaproteobacteria bacterium]